MDNRYCFFDGDEWQSALTSLTCADKSPFGDCSEAVSSLWSCAYSIPSLFRDVQDILFSSSEAQSEDLMSSLFFRAQSLRQGMGTWFVDYSVVVPSQRLKGPDRLIDTRLDERFEAVALCLAGAMILNRLLVATKLAAENANSIEDETQKIAHHLLDLVRTLCPVNPRASLFLGTKVETAKSVIISEASWRHSISTAHSNGRAGPILKEAFERWCIYLGRKPGDEDHELSKSAHLATTDLARARTSSKKRTDRKLDYFRGSRSFDTTSA